jgi:hypothetical protein
VNKKAKRKLLTCHQMKQYILLLSLIDVSGGHYYISVDKKVFDELKQIDDDLNKAIFSLCLQNRINN